MLPLCVSSGSKLCLGSAPLLLPLLEKCAQKSKILIIFHLLFSIADGPGEAKGCQSFGAQVSSILSCDTVYDRLRILSPSRLRPLLPVLRLCPPTPLPLKMCSRRLEVRKRLALGKQGISGTACQSCSGGIQVNLLISVLIHPPKQLRGNTAVFILWLLQWDYAATDQSDHQETDT